MVTNNKDPEKLSGEQIDVHNAVNMPKLNAQELRFIDTYLKNSHVEYVDIRFEMADHVATALEGMEGDFHENFRVYMAHHKRELMQANRKFAKVARNRAIQMLFTNMLKPFPVMVTALVIVAIRIFPVDLELASNLIKGFAMCPFMVMLIMWLKKRDMTDSFSVTGKLFTSLLFIAHLLLFIIPTDRFVEDNPFIACIYNTLLFLFISVNLYTWHSLKRTYRKTYSLK